MIRLNEYIEVINKYPLLRLCNLAACIDDEIIVMANTDYSEKKSNTIHSILFYNKLQSDGVDRAETITDAFFHETFTDIKKFELALERFFVEYRLLKKELRKKMIEEL